MPELPEVETVRADLHAVAVGRRIADVTLGRLRSVRRYKDPELFREQLIGATIADTGRHGKYLLANLAGTSTSADTLVIHLRMSGQILHAASTTEHEKKLRAHTHVRIHLDDDTEVQFVDPRTFGEMFVINPERAELSHLGPDALDESHATVEHLVRSAKGRRVALKAFLLDQSVVAGVGSIYADEICHAAGLRPARGVHRVTGPQFARVHEAMRLILTDAIAARGSTLGDGQYVGLDGEPGTFALRHQVHARMGLPCPTCATVIRRGIVAQRSAYWCPTCQK